MIKIPGLIDIHVHIREPGATHKEDWESGTAAALAGGITAMLAMPNTDPPITDATTLSNSLSAARQKAYCDYAQFLGAGPDNFDVLPKLGKYTVGMKMYLDQTYGRLRLDEMILWMKHFKNWPPTLPIAVHAEGRTLAAVILLAYLYDRSLHVCHVSLREEIILIKKAKNRGLKITCEVTPHHLFLSKEDIPSIGEGRSEVRPRLAATYDRDALWENLNIIDCFATDHAPHTLSEKDSSNPPPGFPGLETALPLLCNAVNERRLSFDDIVERMYTNPRKIFNLPDQPDTWIEIDQNEEWEIEAKNLYTRCAWTPFEGAHVFGKVKCVVLRGQKVFQDGRLLASPGIGLNLRPIF
jgi:carbamoyl-phosphate synthase/aspartate carbamoyltransferase/dihydroorotase